MEAKSRTEYSAKNTTVAVVSRIVAILMGFATRVVFTHTLSEAYVGINGLFTDILNVLALSELGVGTAITYALYKPIAQADIERQKSLMQIYRLFYRAVACIVLGLGLLIIPFMGVFIKNQPDVNHLILIYLLYLANSVISYLLIYKRTLIDAHQLIYVGTLNQTIFLVIQDVAQIIILLITRNFLLFLIVYLICTVGSNVSISRKADKLYPYLKDKNIAKLPKQERSDIYKNIQAMLMHKVGTVVVNNTDNLLISAFVGVVSVGKYSNYYLLIGSIRQILDQIFQGITASVGNLGVTADRFRVKKIFETSFFIGQWIYGVAAICLYEILNPFVELSFGSNYVFEVNIVLILCVNFYVTGMRKATLVFQDSMGLFWHNRHKAIVEAIINLVASIILASKFGIIGVFAGTLISTLATSTWVEPFVLYKHKLQCSMVGYMAKYALYTCVLFLAWLATDCLCGYCEYGLIITIILRTIICIFVPNVILLLAYFRTKEFIFVVEKAKEVINKWLDKNATATNDFVEEEEDALNLAPIERAILKPEEELLLKTIKSSLGIDPSAMDSSLEDLNIDWGEFFHLARMHAVTPFLYDALAQKKAVPEFYREQLVKISRQTVQQSYRLLYLSKGVTTILAQAGIGSLVLKGAAISAYYPVPELRKSGDVDILLLNPADINRAISALCAEGMIVSHEQHGNHHVALETPEGIEVEIHTMLAEPFDNDKINKYLDRLVIDCSNKNEVINAMGVDLDIPRKSEFAFHLLLHMLQHFLRAGFGIKLLCDWVVFWNSGIEKATKEQYLLLAEESGLRGFSDLITATCVEYLGLNFEEVSFMLCEIDKAATAEMIREIFDAEEFGHSSSDRMVILRDASLLSYIREFHHQMRLNHPKASGIFLTWPILWVVTLIVFLRNNRRVRGTSAAQIFKTAKNRSKLIKKMRLFKA